MSALNSGRLLKGLRRGDVEMPRLYIERTLHTKVVASQDHKVVPVKITKLCPYMSGKFIQREELPTYPP